MSASLEDDADSTETVSFQGLSPTAVHLEEDLVPLEEQSRVSSPHKRAVPWMTSMQADITVEDLQQAHDNNRRTSRSLAPQNPQIRSHSEPLYRQTNDEDAPDTVSLWQQLSALLWRNFLLKKTRKTLVEILLPLFLYFTLIPVAQFSGSMRNEGKLPAIQVTPDFQIVPPGTGDTKWRSTISDSALVDSLLDNQKTLSNISPWPMLFGYVAKRPQDISLANDLMSQIFQQPAFLSDFLDAAHLRRFDSESDLLNFYLTHPSQLFAGIVFDQLDKSPPQLLFRVRMNGSHIPIQEHVPSPFVSLLDCRLVENCVTTQYISSGFVIVQAAIYETFLQMVRNTTIVNTNANITINPNQISMAAYPRPELLPQPDLQTFKYLFCYDSVLAFSGMIQFLLVQVVSEKEKRIKHGLFMMGLRTGAFWLGWAVTCALQLTITVTLMTSLAVWGGLVHSSNAVILFLILFLYGFSIITFSFMLTPLFAVAKTAGTVGGFVSMFVSILYVPLTRLQAARSVMLTASLMSPVALTLSLDALVTLDRLNTETAQMQTRLSIADGVMMLIIDALIYLLLAYYFDAVIPGVDGVRRVWYFPVLPLLEWMGVISSQKYKRLLDDAEENGENETIANNHLDQALHVTDPADIEPVSPELRPLCAIQLQRICKSFQVQGKTIHALNNVTLDMYEGQIFALLGHNAAGKSTLIHILSGLYPPTSGMATVYGYNIITHMHQIRRMTGFCAQQDILFEELSAYEHLVFYGRIKGIPLATIELNAVQLGEALLLTDVLHRPCRHLSGGQRRKVSLAIAFMGDPKIVFLDEPTNSLDTYSRRMVWQFLQERKRHCCIILTTHFLDEADVLAERKAILTQGKVRCMGSSLFLKTRFGLGYHLKLWVHEEEASVVVHRVQQLGQQCHLQGLLTFKARHGDQVEFTLALESPMSAMTALFSVLDEWVNRGEFLLDYGLSMTTLEQVFLRLEADEHATVLAASDNKSVVGTALDQKLSESQVIKESSNQNTDAANRNAMDAVALQDLSSPTHQDIQADIAAALVELPIVIREPHFDRSLYAMFWMRCLQTVRSGKTLLFQLLSSAMFLLFAWISLSRSSAAVQMDRFQVQLFTLPTEMGHVYYTGDVVVLWTRNWLYAANNNSMAEPSAFLLTISQPNEIHFLVNDSYIHAYPLGVALFYEQQFLLLNDSSMSSSASHPLPYKRDFDRDSFTAILLGALMLTIGLNAPLNGKLMDALRDKEDLLLFQSRVMGASASVYWLGFLLRDLLFMLPQCIGMIILMAASHIAPFDQQAFILCFIALLFWYVTSLHLYVYVLSFVFDKSTTGAVLFPTLHQLSYTLPAIVILVMGIVDPLSLSAVNGVMSLLLIPHPLIWFLVASVQRFLVLPEGTDLTVWDLLSPWQESGLAFLSVLFHCLVLAGLLFVLEKRKWTRQRQPSRHGTVASASVSPEEDASVQQERERIDRLYPTEFMHHQESDDILVMQHLHQSFNVGKSNEFVAVHDLCLTLSLGEIFALLGPNGAGKSVTLSMAVGQSVGQRGRLLFQGRDTLDQCMYLFDNLGYCPQQDALWPELNTREHLSLVAALRGLTPRQLEARLPLFLKALNLSEDQSYLPVSVCSGGTKRKISMAVALLSDPTLLILDEPSSAMDPFSRQCLWTLLENTKSQRATLVTTHYMDEAALCHRLAILVKGRLKCLGSLSQLQSLYGKGYQLQVTLLSAGHVPPLQQFVKQVLFQDAKVLQRDSFGAWCCFDILPPERLSLGRVFQLLEEKRESLGLVQYALSQVTLEQIFIHFAKQQLEEESEVNQEEGQPADERL